MRHAIAAPVVLALLSGSMLAPRPGAGEGFVVRIDRTERRELFLADLGHRTERQLYRASAGRIVEARVSPAERYVAVLETDGEQRNRLLVIDRSGRLVSTVEDQDVRRFAFDPDGRRIAYLAGAFYPGGVGFVPEGAYVVDLQAGVSTPVAGVAGAYEVEWPVHGGGERLHFRTLVEGSAPSAVRVDLTTGQIEPIDPRVFHLSPDGRFALRPADEAARASECGPSREGSACFRVFRADSVDRPVDDDTFAALGTPLGWALNTGHLLLFQKREAHERWEKIGAGGRFVEEPLIDRLKSSENYLFDADRARVARRISGQVSRAASLGDWVCCSAHLVSWPVDLTPEDALGRGRLRLISSALPAPVPQLRPAPKRAGELPPVLDFDQDAAGRPLEVGRAVGDEWAAFGVHVRTGRPERGAALIFDSAAPTGGDVDLGTPNESFGGPGIGSGGAEGAPGENAVEQHKVLIIGSAQLRGGPGDSRFGGTLIFDFDYEVQVSAVDILDVDDPARPGTVRALDAAGATVAEAEMVVLGDNSLERVPLDAGGVRRLEVFFPGSGALAAVHFVVLDSTPLLATVDAWASAWSGQRIDDYLSFYSAAFEPQLTIDRSAWAAERRERLSEPGDIEIQVVSPEAWYVGAGRGVARFDQLYRSDRFSDRVTKSLDLVLEDGAWKIAGEWVED